MTGHADYLSVLNEEQRRAVMHSGSPLLILAGAGSGKTRVITTKIAYLISELGYDPRSILAVTFTKKAANEMAVRAAAMDERAAYAQIRTFHSFGSWLMRLYARDAGLNPDFTVYDDEDMVNLLMKAHPGLLKREAAETARLISRAKDYDLSPDAADFSPLRLEEQGRDAFVCSEDQLRELYGEYERRRSETGNFDFGDLIMQPLAMLRDCEAVRASVHRRFKVVMVDEYQDANRAQFLLLRELAGKDTYICVVGDDDQSIYRFRGAEVSNILSFSDQFAHTEIVRLEKNYRSLSPILAAADSVVSHNQNRLGKTLRAARQGSGMIPKLAFLSNQDEEAAFCAELIERFHNKGCPYADWAVLYRTNAQSLSFETEFLHRKLPYTVVGSLKFYEREEVKDLIALLKLVLNPRDVLSFERMVNKPTRGVGRAALRKIEDALAEGAPDYIAASRNALSKLPKQSREGLREFAGLIERFTEELGEEEDLAGMLAREAEGAQSAHSAERLSAFVERLAEQSGLAAHHGAKDEIAGTQRLSNMQELANSAEAYQLTRSGLVTFIDSIELDRSLALNKEESQDAVTLITLHNTKGLEFPRVIITGMEKGVFPRGDKTGDDLEEERRLFYVGITRARDELYLTSCKTRRLYGRIDFMTASPFLSEMGRDKLRLLGDAPLYFTESLSSPEPNREEETKWRAGVRIFHDEYGYGWIQSSRMENGERVIIVRFETGQEARFLPAYQGHTLSLIDE